MQNFTGLNYLQIDIANCFGLDKEEWVTRLIWFEEHKHELEDLIDQADEPMLYVKAISAYARTMKREPSGHILYLDATASGIGIMAALSGCHKTAREVNIINTGTREDVYATTANKINKHLSSSEYVTRDDIKLPLMTHFYNKTVQDTLTENQQAAFYIVLGDTFEGAEAVKDTINQFWNPEALAHTFTLPDGHVAHIPVTEMLSARIEVDELDHSTFTYQFEVNQPSKVKTSLCPNIIHAIDGYIVRQMVERSHALGFQITHVHDAIGAHPNNMQAVRQLYVEILAEIAKSNLLQDILSEISGTPVKLQKYSNDLHLHILNSEYALS